jgi:uncharacterized protein
MQCPTDGTTLVMSERSGIEIDYCPQCRGVWLDRGELDKIIERADAGELPARPTQPPRPAGQPHYEQRRDDHHSDDRRYDSHGKPHKKHKESFLGDMFDF